MGKVEKLPRGVLGYPGELKGRLESGERAYMVEIDLESSLESFRRFVVYSSCRSYMPSGYLSDPTIFPERDSRYGTIHVEALSKIELTRMRDVSFVKAHEVLGIIYASKSGNTRLRWRHIEGRKGRLRGEASINSLANLLRARILRPQDIGRLGENDQ